jgi:Holliday junction resolvase RusA-like endonuclease
MKFIIPGEPKGKGRPRVTKTGHAFTPKDTLEYENWVKQCYVNCEDRKLLDGQIYAKIDCYFSIPKSATIKKSNMMRQNIIRPCKKPDVDNVCKSILDSLNGIAYKDDSQIVDCLIRKWYADEPRVEVRLQEVKI